MILYELESICDITSHSWDNELDVFRRCAICHRAEFNINDEWHYSKWLTLELRITDNVRYKRMMEATE